MKVAVCIKQVPVGSVPMENGGNLNRSLAGTRLNPGDGYALEAAVTLAQATGGTVTAFTMGPPSAQAVLKAALPMGVSVGILLTDRAFAGADVYATAYTLAQGIRAVDKFDVVICGQQSTDGDTAQLPFSLACQLGIPALGWVKDYALQDGRILVNQELSLGTQQAEVTTPCLLAVGTGCKKPRIPSLRDQLRARSGSIRILGLSDLEDRNPDHYGQAGSPTRVVSVRNIEQLVRCQPRQLAGADTAAAIYAAIREVKTHG